MAVWKNEVREVAVPINSSCDQFTSSHRVDLCFIVAEAV